MLSAEILPPAADDFEQGYRWYFEREPRAAHRFAEMIDRAIDKIRSKPLLGIRIDDEHRFYRIKKSFPYYLVYRIEATKIVIVAIAHNAQHPDYWRSR
jgi:plasmid stabilization system protein ParE